MKEIWKDVVDYEKFYQVSNLGRVRSKDRLCWNGVNWWTMSGKILKQYSMYSNNYLGIYIYNESKKRKTILIHRLVAMAFIENPENKPQVNHKDGDKHNNKLDNLEWNTCKENLKHARDTGLNDPTKLRHILEQYSLDGVLIKRWGIGDDVRDIGTNRHAISESIRRDGTSAGFKWRSIKNG